MSDLKINNNKGIAINIISMLLFASLDVIVKKLVATMPVYEVVFYRSLTGIPIFIIAVHFTAGLQSFKIYNWKLQFARGALGVTGMFFFFNSYKYLPLGEAASIIFSAPLILTLLSVLFLKEKIGIHRITAVLVGFVGVLCIVRPGTGYFSIYALLPFAGAIIWSLVIIVMRFLSKTDSANATTLVFSLFGVTVGGILMLVNGATPITDWNTAFLLLLTGLFGVFAQFAMTQAVVYCEASVFASTKYISLIFTVTAGFIFFDEVPIWLSFVGMALIIMAGLYTVFREHTLKKARKIRTVRY